MKAPSLRITIPALLTVFISVAAAVSLRIGTQRAELRTREAIVSQTNRLMTRVQASLAHAAAAGDTLWTQEEVGTLGADPLIQLAILIDEKAAILASTRLEQVGRQLSDVVDPTHESEVTDGVSSATTSLVGRVVSISDRQLLAIYPVTLGGKIGDIRSTRVGALVVTVNIDRPIADAVATMREEVVIFSAALAVMVLLVALFLHFRVARRLARLAQITSDYASGDHDARATVGSRNEIGKLEQRFNEMAEQRQANELQLRQSQKMEAIGQLASGVAHDFNNLLMGISGTAELLSRKTMDAEERQTLLGEITSATRSGADVVRQLLAFSRRDKNSSGAASIDGTVAKTEPMIRRLIGEDINLKASLEADVYVGCGEGPLQQIIINLAVNARDAMPEGGELSIATEESGGRGVLRIRDSGTGMHPDVVERVFEPFFTTKREGDGTGLGLATVYGIVTSVGGTIMIETELGEGTEFVLRFPVVEKPKDELEPVLEGARTPSETILVIEDEAMVRRTIESYLEDTGYRVFSAASAEEAMRVSAERADEIQLVLSDVVLPDEPGPKVTAALAKQLPNLLVLFMSAHPKPLLVANGRISEDANLLQKPFEKHEILDKLSELFGEVRGDNLRSDPNDVPAATNGDSPRSRRASILLVEDDALSRSATTELLVDEGFDVVATDCARAALDAVEKAPMAFGVVITDLGLPDMRGDRLAEKLLEASKAESLAVIFVSGSSPRDSDVRLLPDARQVSFLTKPVDIDELVREVERSLAL